MSNEKMSLKFTEQGRKILVRRWKYSPERKRSLPTTVFSTSIWRPDPTLPEEVIKEHSVTDEELKEYENYINSKKEEEGLRSEKTSLLALNFNLKRVESALSNPEACEEITLGQYEEMSEILANVKKLVTKNKQALKRKLKK
ncbi:TPA: hypothetical protein ACOLZF_004618 [Vibrio parahaemolyticus]